MVVLKCAGVRSRILFCAIRSGNMDDLVTLLLYLLMRDEVVPGIMERIVRECEGQNPDQEVIFSNKHLEAYARDLVKRLRDGRE